MDYAGALLLGRYRILKFIGEGGMSLVYQSQNTANNTLAAVKFMKKRVTSSYNEDSIRFKKELDIISRLTHPGIARVFGSGEYEGTLFYVMEFLEGESFERYILGKPVFEWNEIAGIFLKLAEILSYVHRNGIVHKDLKPSNFFITKVESDIHFKLFDFGVAHIMELGEMKGEAEIAGTFGYMSPEAAGLFRADVDERSDLYSLGIMFYRLLTGELPFRGADAGRLLHQQAAAVPVSPCKINKEIPAVLEAITMKLLAKDPDLRYQSAGGLLYDINRYIKGDTGFYIGGGDRKDRLTYRTKLVGRKRETEEIAGLIRKAQQGKGSVCLIGGEAGSGKSRLVEELKNVYRQDLSFLEARCLNHENKTPYQPFRDILDEYIGALEKSGAEAKETEAAKMREISGDFGEILVRLNPRIKRFLGETKALVELEPARENQRFLRVLSDFFCSYCEKAGGCVLVLEDLQWVDDGSIGLLREISGKIAGSHLLVIGTYRNDEVDGEHGIKRLVKGAGQHEYPIEEIVLERLNHENVNELAACVLREKTENVKTLAGYLFEKSGGNPLYTISVLRELIENKMVARNDEGRYEYVDKSGSLQMPENMLGIIMNRAGRLDALCRELLCKAAVIGREFEIELLHRLTGFDYEELVGIIDHAVSMQLLSKSPDKRSLLFAHDRIRDAFYDMPEEPARRALHRDIAAAVEVLRGDDIEEAVYELAHHYIEAKDGQKALQYAILAGDKAKKSYANEEAVKFYNTALGLLDGRKSRELSEWIRINECLIEVYLLIGRANEAIRMSEKLLPMLETPIGKAGIYKKVGIAYFKKGDWKNCEENIEAGLRLLGERAPVRKTEVFVLLAGQMAVHLLHGLMPEKVYRKSVPHDPEGKKEIVSSYYTLSWAYGLSDFFRCIYGTLRSLNLSETEIGPSRELGTSLSTYAGMCMTASFFKEGLRYHQKALKLRRDLDDKWGQAQTFQFLGYNHHWMGDYAQGIECFRKSIALFREIGDSWEEGQSLVGVTGIFIYKNLYAEGLRGIRHYFGQSKKTNDIYGMNAARTSWARILIETGDFKEAEELLREALASSRENNIMILYCLALGYLGFLYMETGQYDRAVENLELSVECYLKNSFLPDPLLQIFPHLADAYVKNLTACLQRAGSKPTAAEISKARLLCRTALKKTKNWISHYSTALKAAAGFYALTGKSAKAEKLYKKAIECSERLGRRYEAAKGYLEYGMFLDAAGRRWEVPGNFQKAYELFSDIGAKAYANKCETLLSKDADEKTYPVGKTYPAGPAARDRLRSERRMNTVLAAGKYISSILNLDELLEKIMEGTVELVGAERGVLLLYPEDGGVLSAKAFHHVDGEKELENGHAVSASIISRVEKEKTPLLIADALSEELFKNSSSVVLGAVKSVICAPITAKGEMLGVIYLDNNLVNGLFDENDLETVSILAGQAGVSIQNARMYSHLAQWNKTLELRVEERTGELSKRNLELASAVARLKEYAATVEELAVARERNRFALDAHDHLGHSLTLVIKLLEVSRMTCLDAPDKLDEKLEEAERIAREGLEELRASVKGLIPDRIHIGGLQEALGGLAEDFRPLGIQVDFAIQGLEDIGDTARVEILRAICAEASTNAVKHGKAENISIIIRKADGQIRMVIFDNGGGCKNIVKGFGLSGMEKRVSAMNGTIGFNSDGENGFIIRVELPYGRE